MQMNEEDYLAHYGTPRRSGRYPWGSGGTETTDNKTFLDHIKSLQKQGYKDTEIAEGFGMKTTEFRAVKSIARNELKAEQINMALKLNEKQYSYSAGARKMGIPESTYRTLIAPGAKDKTDKATVLADILQEQVDRQGIVDIGLGVDSQLGVPSTQMNTALVILQKRGYPVRRYPQPQLTNFHDTKMKVLCPPGTTQKEAWEKRADVKTVDLHSDNHSYTPPKRYPPIGFDPNRVAIRYKEDGGDSADGVIFVRPGVADVSLGPGARYSQVRIKVGDNHYLKGMAMYKDDLPPGADLVFNTPTSKKDSKSKFDVMKELKPNKDFPFGAITRPIVLDAGTDKERVVSVMNLVNDQADWEKWSNQLSSQMLSKQNRPLAKTQLDMTYERRKDDYENIKALTNTVIRKKLLEDFADNTDSAAVHLKAASLPAQKVHVLLPLSKIKQSEVYAPRYANGTPVVLVRHPHGGPFEIPRLIVNNRSREGKALIGDETSSAIGIHHKVAELLSGADFDGDTVLVIPDRGGRITTEPPLADLKGFDPRTTYKKFDGMKVMKDTQGEMGSISNLITDMSIKGAPNNELARAVKHSMVVIDAEKHELNYKQSERDHGIRALQEKYQRNPVTGRAGAATLISRARSQERVLDRKPRPAALGGRIDIETGELKFVPTDRPNKKGEPRKFKSTKLAEAKDAYTLSSGTPMESLYADHSNKLKALANQARLDSFRTQNPPQSQSAKEVYASQAKSLDAKLQTARKNAPFERQAQAIGNATYQAKVHANPHMDDAEKKRLRTQEQDLARIRTGAKKKRIVITPDEWEAIQAGAISASMLNKILTHADMDVVKKFATPKETVLMTSAKTARMQNMIDLGYDRADIAQALGVSVSTLDKTIAGL